jgi:hypothetical protein
MAGIKRPSYEASQNRIQEIQQQADLEDEAAKHRGLNVDVVQVPNYWYKRTPNVPPNINLAGMKLTRIVKLIDAEGECVGTFEDDKLLFRKHWRGVCDDKAIQKRYDKTTVGT